MTECALPRFVKIPYRVRAVQVRGAPEARLLRLARAVQLDAEAAAWEDGDCDEGWPVPERSDARRARARRLVVTLERTESTLDPRYRMGVVRITERN